MLDILIKKVSKDPEYLVWYFNKYMELENKNLSEVQTELGADQETYHRLALCKIPKDSRHDFSSGIKHISDYAGINSFPLIRLLKCVNTFIAFSSNSEQTNAVMMAAREKQTNPIDKNISTDL